jgi:hypothetical protein
MYVVTGGGLTMKSLFKIALRVAAIAAALVVLGWVFALVLPANEAGESNANGMTALMLSFLGSFVLAAPLYYPVSRSKLTGLSLFGVVFFAIFGLTTVLTLVEAAFFLNMTTAELATEFVRTTLLSVALAGLAVTLYPRADFDPPAPADRANPPTVGSWARRWTGVAFLYVLLYFTAGILILPIIRTWYESLGTLEPNPVQLLLLQIARGAFFVACVVPLLRSMTVSRRQASLSMAFMIPLVHAIAGLIPPNPFMPDHVRFAHMIEIGWSNFVLGLVIGFLFWKPYSKIRESADAAQDPA